MCQWWAFISSCAIAFNQRPEKRGGERVDLFSSGCDRPLALTHKNHKNWMKAQRAEDVEFEPGIKCWYQSLPFGKRHLIVGFGRHRGAEGNWAHCFILAAVGAAWGAGLTFHSATANLTISFVFSNSFLFWFQIYFPSIYEMLGLEAWWCGNSSLMRVQSVGIALKSVGGLCLLLRPK